jgi:plastocyanin
MKKFIAFFSITALGLAIFVLTPAHGAMQAEMTCQQDVLVQADDTLSTLANKIYGDILAFPAIVEATNSKAAGDDSYARITNPNVLEIGWKLCIPSPTEAALIMDRLAPEAISGPVVGPEVDRVGFPTDYQSKFAVFYEFDRAQNKTARVVYANPAAASVKAGQDFPYGSVLVMEVHSTLKDDAGNVILDANGKYSRDRLFGLFVMRKEPGFGTKYGLHRNGEWEYVAYRPDGTFLTPPENSGACAACHVEASQGRDWVFGAGRFFGLEPATPAAENEVIIADYTFEPATLTVKAGSEVKWLSQDVVFHTVTAKDLSFSGALRPGQSFSHTFETPGTFEYFSALYPSVSGRIEVVE